MKSPCEVYTSTRSPSAGVPSILYMAPEKIQGWKRSRDSSFPRRNIQRAVGVDEVSVMDVAAVGTKTVLLRCWSCE